MIKQFESFHTVEDSGLKPGDKVIIKYKDKKYYMKTGKIVSIRTIGPTQGDCLVKMDYRNEIKEFFYTYLSKIQELVEVPSGEIFNVLDIDAMELAMAGLIKYNSIMRYYYFDEENRWQIESYAI